jgi:hypothetical protein
MQTERYRYRNMPIPGGGYVTGFAFHPKAEGVFYLRTDIGGTYRFDPGKKRWCSLIDHVTMEDVSETFPAAIALDERHPEKLYIACGMYAEEHGRFAVSKDYGENFDYYEMPMHVHGNMNGKGTGYRLIADQKCENILWFASQDSGLWKSCDGGSVIGGKVVRYPVSDDGRIGQGEDITPPPADSFPNGENVGEAGDRDEAGNRPDAAGRAGSEFLEYGFAGIDASKSVPGLVVVSTISKGDGDCIYRSMDYGRTWKCILCDLEIGTMSFRMDETGRFQI